MSVKNQKRLLLEQRAIEELAERIGRDSYMDVQAVCDRLGFGREKIEALPIEILPYADYGIGKNSLRRYHPADVLAADARMRAWKQAQDRGEGEAYLEQLRQELEARDEAALQLAREMNEALHSAA